MGKPEAFIEDEPTDNKKKKENVERNAFLFLLNEEKLVGPRDGIVFRTSTLGAAITLWPLTTLPSLKKEKEKHFPEVIQFLY